MMKGTNAKTPVHHIAALKESVKSQTKNFVEAGRKGIN